MLEIALNIGMERWIVILTSFLVPPFDRSTSNTDKMSDEEKLPIAIAGVAFITLPFIAGLIALYSAQN
jgi:hypothetical protein